MFNVLVKKHITSAATEADDGSASWRAFYRLIKLPFVPVVGMSLSANGWTPGVMERIHWQQSDDGLAYFTCTVKTERPVVFNGYDYSFEYLCNEALGQGWFPYEATTEPQLRMELMGASDTAVPPA
ncbi:hypothetical protein CIW54_07155 [Paraburkholderia sp. T12-10]|nr:hypothetical protein CIW54_07155 [Paraburkholderia sp. T12-10]